MILLVKIIVLDMTMWSNSREERLKGKLKVMHGASSIGICSRIVGGN